MSVPLLYSYVMALFERTKRLYGFPRWCSGKESACQAGDVGLIHGSGRSPGEKHGDPLQYSCLENSMDRGACQATIHGVTKIRRDIATKQWHFSKGIFVVCSVLIIFMKIMWKRKHGFPGILLPQPLLTVMAILCLWVRSSSRAAV